MKVETVYNIFNNFINDIKYMKYFNIYKDNVRDWKIKLDKLKQFIDDNLARPTLKTNKELHKWLSHQITNSKKRLEIMKDDEIFNSWNEFINDDRYSEYFINN